MTRRRVRFACTETFERCLFHELAGETPALPGWLIFLTPFKSEQSISKHLVAICELRDSLLPVAGLRRDLAPPLLLGCTTNLFRYTRLCNHRPTHPYAV